MTRWSFGSGEGRDPAYLVFRAGGERFGVPVGKVQGAARARQIVPLPGAPATYAGLAFVRGEPVGVLDACEALGLRAAPRPGAGERNVLLILEGGGRALLVDRIESVEEIPSAAIGPPPAGSRLITGLVPSGSRLLHLLEVDAVLEGGSR